MIADFFLCGVVLIAIAYSLAIICALIHSIVHAIRPLMFWVAFPFLLIAVIIWETVRCTRNTIRSRFKRGSPWLGGSRGYGSRNGH